MSAAQRAILAIDEGTSGTRAALVFESGVVGRSEYRALPPPLVRGGAVEVDAEDLWEKTLDASRVSLRAANETDVEVVGLAISNQRVTSVLWNRRTGLPLVRASTWQDSRYADELAELGTEWDNALLRLTGRTTGVRSPYLWAAHHLRDTPLVAAAYEADELGFGTIETWLMWKLTGGGTYATTSTNLCAAGAYDLVRNEYAHVWTDRLGVPREILPELREDGDLLGVTRADVLGEELPIVAAVGDQLAGIIGLGGIGPGDATCIHGTGSFLDLANGTSVPSMASSDGTALGLLGWRQNHASSYSIESFSPSTGSALNWLSGSIGLFDTPHAISALASSAPGSNGVTFLPSLAGFRNPVASTRAGGSFSGLSLSTTKPELAYAVLEGIAHSTADCTESVAGAAGVLPHSIRAGGGISASDTLLQLQADLIGMPIYRVEGGASASLRGAAFLGASRGLFWDSLADAVATVHPLAQFSPQLTEDERIARREGWRRCVDLELERSSPTPQATT